MLGCSIAVVRSVDGIKPILLYLIPLGSAILALCIAFWPRLLETFREDCWCCNWPWILWGKRSGNSIPTLFGYFWSDLALSGRGNWCNLLLLPHWLLQSVGSFKIMGHSIINWGSYIHLHLWPVLSDQTIYIPFIFIMYLTRISEQITSLWLSWMFFGIFGLSIYLISNPSPIISKRCYCPRPNWKSSKKWWRRKLYYLLIHCCRHQPKNLPPRLDGSFFPLPYCAKN